MVTPLLEGLNGGTGAFSLPSSFRSGSIATERSVVTDYPADAWDESDKPALDDLRNTFGDDLAEAHETDLRRAGCWLIETHLRAEWRKRGFFVAFNDGPDSDIYAVPADEVCRQVWQAAADAITDRDLVLEASLGHVFQMTTDLERHRAALHHRLNAIADTFDDDTCEKAWQQLESWRGATDSAVTRAQLIEISAHVDQFVTRIPA